MRYEPFSKRQRQLQSEIPDVYQYETIPQKLRVQVVHIWDDIFDVRIGYGGVKQLNIEAYTTYCFIENQLCRAYGMFELGIEEDMYERVVNFLVKTEETEKVIDVIELSFWCIDPKIHTNKNDNDNCYFSSTVSPDEAIDELNYRFREQRVGYQYESGQIIKVDSQFVHSEVVKPALSFLSDPIYKGANEEFLKAHEHYRKRDYKDCVNNCLKAFESCLKAICQKRGWHYDSKKAAAKDLIRIVFDNGLIPSFMLSHFSALKSTLESGLPTVRNREAGHGQGPETIVVPEYIAGYALHLTASNILLLAKADGEMK